MLRLRTKILRDSKTIDEDVYDYVMSCIDILEQEVKNFEPDKAEMIITHIAMAMQRVKNDEKINELDDFIWEGIQKEENFDYSVEIYEKLASISKIAIPNYEKRFIITHICNLTREGD